MIKLLTSVSLFVLASGQTDLVHTTDDVHFGELMEGDIMVDEDLVARLKALEDTTEKDGSGHRRRLGLAGNALWDNGIFYYAYDSAFPADWRVLVREAMDAMEETLHPDRKCVRFVEIPDSMATKQYHVKFVKEDGCWSYMGKVQNDDYFKHYQKLSMDPGCWEMRPGQKAIGVVMHELMHALGFFHEQSRSDRDEYIRVNVENLTTATKGSEEWKDAIYNWKKMPEGLEMHDTTYDYNSIMHYLPMMGSMNGKPVIERLNQPHGSNGETWTEELVDGFYTGLSAHDIFEIREAYNCPSVLEADIEDRCDEIFLEKDLPGNDWKCPPGSRLITGSEAAGCKEQLCSKASGFEPDESMYVTVEIQDGFMWYHPKDGCEISPRRMMWNKPMDFCIPIGEKVVQADKFELRTVGEARCKDPALYLNTPELCQEAATLLGLNVNLSDEVNLNSWSEVCGCSYDLKTKTVKYNNFRHPCYCNGECCPEGEETCEYGDQAGYGRQHMAAQDRDGVDRQPICYQKVSVTSGNYKRLGNGWCTMGGRRVGLADFWSPTAIREDHGADLCEQRCDADPECIGYQTEDGTKCQLMPGDKWGEKLSSIDGVDSERRNYCWIKVQKENYKLLFRQTAGLYLDPVSKWKSVNPGKPDGPNYSILDQLHRYKGKDGKFTFKLVWPERHGANYNVWKQSTNPVTDTKGQVAGYEAIDVKFTDKFWGGLESGYLHSSSPKALLDGSVNHGYWHYAVGSKQAWHGKIPGAKQPETVVELYVKVPVEVPADIACEDGWEFHDGSCYLFPQKHGADHDMTWWAARDYCESLGAFLPSLKDEAEEEFLRGWLRKEENSRFTFWIGVVEGKSRLHDGSTKTDDLPFPRNYHDPVFCYAEGEEKCGRLNGGYWTYVNCKNEHCGQGTYPVCFK